MTKPDSSYQIWVLFLQLFENIGKLLKKTNGTNVTGHGKVVEVQVVGLQPFNQSPELVAV